MRRRVAGLAALLLLGSAGAAVAHPADGPRGPARPRAADQAPAGAAVERVPTAGRVGPARGVWPLEPPHPVVRGFDPPDAPWGRGHRGVDLQGRIWAPVLAAMGGVVRHAGPIAGRGVVVVGHGATRTTYEPLTPAVSVGDRVRAGDVVGHLQLAGSHCLPATCLHWGWLRGETYLDPLALVGTQPVRLKPVDGPAGTPVAAAPW